MNKKYAVTLEGKGFRLKRAASADPIPTGFFTTRFVQATGPEEAIARAIELVHRELADLPHEAMADSSITVDELRENPEAYDRFAPGKGFTWF